MSRAHIVKPGKITLSDEKAYGLILSPVITEKATMGSEHNQVTFKVPLDATKPEIKAAVEKLFKVKVKAVNTLDPEGQGQALPRPHRPAQRREEGRRDAGRGPDDRRDHGDLTPWR
jgi:large subunit ribosomal protein L23